MTINNFVENNFSRIDSFIFVILVEKSIVGKLKRGSKDSKNGSSLEGGLEENRTPLEISCQKERAISI